jgi:hypothetical protein
VHTDVAGKAIVKTETEVNLKLDRSAFCLEYNVALNNTGILGILAAFLNFIP